MNFTLQDVDTIVEARAKVLHASQMKEDRLKAVTILSDFWRNRRKEYKLEQELSRLWLQMVSKLMSLA